MTVIGRLENCTTTNEKDHGVWTQEFEVYFQCKSIFQDLGTKSLMLSQEFIVGVWDHPYSKKTFFA